MSSCQRSFLPFVYICQVIRVLIFALSKKGVFLCSMHQFRQCPRPKLWKGGILTNAKGSDTMEVSKAEGKGECRMLNAECRISLPLEGKVLNESEADEVEIPENIDGNTSFVSLRLPPLAAARSQNGSGVINTIHYRSAATLPQQGRLVGSGSARPKSPLPKSIFAGGSEPEIPRRHLQSPSIVYSARDDSISANYQINNSQKGEKKWQKGECWQ